MTAADEVVARAPAKINLALGVGPLRPDGYHELATVFHAVSLVDEVAAAPADDITVTVEGVQADEVPTDEGNLAVRAARLLALRAGVAEGARLRIRKGIPVAGGMAGGSADAAAALIACDALWRVGLSREDLAELAAELGSDVPFCLFGGTAIGAGRGEQVTPALARGEYHWVVATADHGLSTPQVFAELDRLRAGQEVPMPRITPELMQALRSGDPVALAGCLSNDLQEAAVSLAPRLRRTLDLGRDAGALAGLVSGSGPTVVFLVAGPEQALDVAVGLTAAGAVRDVHRVHGPVPGARLAEPVRA
ncbi:MAG TPA: 4-(cytidine 5'-diphospho)-2-C-methyl-D-erythritol kinase [Kineosporiaceae bacterium]|nr:4-(cytidine 5'-diphospho)-2-C-methyl-D-erythritol kinase [Kineosporiaceae bacterium]